MRLVYKQKSEIVHLDLTLSTYIKTILWDFINFGNEIYDIS